MQVLGILSQRVKSRWAINRAKGTPECRRDSQGDCWVGFTYITRCQWRWRWGGIKDELYQQQPNAKTIQQNCLRKKILCVSCTVSLAAFFTILKLFPNFHLFAMMIGILSYFTIIALSAFTNTHVRTYTTNLYPFSFISQLRSLRQQRRIACEMVNDLSVVTRGNSRSSW